MWSSQGMYSVVEEIVDVSLMLDARRFCQVGVRGRKTSGGVKKSGAGLPL